MTDFYKLSVPDTLKTLETNDKTGLTDGEVSKRLEQYGKNALPVDAGTNWVKLVVGQFTDLMVLILIAAAAISLFLGDTKDVIVILAIVILNAILGIYQEYQAERALAALSAMQVPLVRVRRNGEVQQLGAGVGHQRGRRAQPAAGRQREHLQLVHGELVQVRDPDGVGERQPHALAQGGDLADQEFVQPVA